MAGEVGRATKCTELEMESNRETGVEILEDWKSVWLFTINQQIVLVQPVLSNNSRVDRELTGELHQEQGEQ